MLNKNSIYSSLIKHIHNGILSEDYRLKYSRDDTMEDKYAPGFEDAKLMLMGVTPPDKDSIRLIITGIRAAGDEDYSICEESFSKLDNLYPAFAAIPFMHHYIYRNTIQFKPNIMHKTALHIILNTENATCLKYGLILLSLTTSSDEKIKDILMNLALCEEFTYYCAENLQIICDNENWIYETLEKTSGWGNLQLIKNINTEDTAIKKAILNCVGKSTLPIECIAMDIWEKSDADELLKEDLNFDEYTAISAILLICLATYMQDSSPFLKNQRKTIKRFIDATKKQELSAYNYNIIFNMGQQLHNESKKEDKNLLDLMEILNSDDCYKKVHQAYDEGMWFDVMTMFGLEEYDGE